MSERCECHPEMKAISAYSRGCRSPQAAAAQKAYDHKNYMENRDRLLAQSDAYRRANPHINREASRKYITDPWHRLRKTQLQRRRRAAERGEEF